MQKQRRVKIVVNASLELDGLLCVQGDEGVRCAVIVCHPHPDYGGTMYNNVVAAVVSEFIDRGATTLRFNYRSTGRGGMAGEGATPGCQGEVEDLLAAICYLEVELGGGPISLSLVGYSFGSCVALKAAEQCAQVKAVCGIAPPVSSMEMEGVGRFEKEKYFIHGMRDDYGPSYAFEAWYKELPQPKEVSLMDADHFYTGKEALVAKQVADKLLD